MMLWSLDDVVTINRSIILLIDKSIIIGYSGQPSSIYSLLHLFVNKRYLKACSKWTNFVYMQTRHCCDDELTSVLCSAASCRYRFSYGMWYPETVLWCFRSTSYQLHHTVFRTVRPGCVNYLEQLCPFFWHTAPPTFPTAKLILTFVLNSHVACVEK